ncbi:MAG: methyltransferase domain-containing protein, partial [Planctomycetes bacterium]|nr:methyltransferase domain-containing protein [Planctomycetota bacterium]
VDDARRRFGVHYVCDDLLAFAAEHVQKFDAVIMTELLEHVPDIFGLLLAAKSCLREAGKIIITTPNIESLPPGALWISDAPPVHLWCFSPASFLAIGARIDCRVNFIDLRPSGLDLPLESFLALDHTKPQRSPSFDSQGHVLLRRSFPDRIRTLLDDMLADAGILRVTRCAKTRLRSRFARRRFGSTPTGLCAQLSP